MSKFRSAYSGHVRHTSLTGDGHEPEYEYKVTETGRELVLSPNLILNDLRRLILNTISSKTTDGLSNSDGMDISIVTGKQIGRAHV